MEDEDILVRLTGGNLIVNSKLIFECLKIFETQKNDYMYINPKKITYQLVYLSKFLKLSYLEMMV
jgi:hypothetical protein